MTAARLNMEPANSSCAFRLTGTGDGLDDFSLKFVPESPASQDTDASAAAIQDVMAPPDRPFAEDFLAGGREPGMDESFGSASVGYERSDSWRRTSPFRRGPDLPTRPPAILGIQEPDMRGDASPCRTRSAPVTLSVPGRHKAQREGRADRSFNRRINACRFRFVRSLHDRDVSRAAETAMFDRPPALAWDRPGQDVFKAIMGAGAATAPGSGVGT